MPKRRMVGKVVEVILAAVRVARKQVLEEAVRVEQREVPRVELKEARRGEARVAKEARVVKEARVARVAEREVAAVPQMPSEALVISSRVSEEIWPPNSKVSEET